MSERDGGGGQIGSLMSLEHEETKGCYAQATLSTLKTNVLRQTDRHKNPIWKVNLNWRFGNYRYWSVSKSKAIYARSIFFPMVLPYATSTEVVAATSWIVNMFSFCLLAMHVKRIFLYKFLHQILIEKIGVESDDFALKNN